jgi:putative multicomponent Na+:H+ antiporter subunit B
MEEIRMDNYIDSYVYVIVALLPLSAVTLVLQVNPYQALIVRAIVGAVAALVYAVLGAADVALTEALVGTMLSIMLYVVAVRSSLVMRLGIVAGEVQPESYFSELIAKIRKVVQHYHLRLEVLEYPHQEALELALRQKEIHATCISQAEEDSCCEGRTAVLEVKQTYHATFRVHRLFEIMQEKLVFPDTTVTYVPVVNEEEKH